MKARGWLTRMGAHEAKRAGRGHEKTRTSALVCAEAYTHEAHTRRSGQGARSRVQGMHTGRRQTGACMGSRGGGEGLDLLVGVGHVDGAAVDPPLLGAPHLQQQHVAAPATAPPSHAASPLRPCACF